MPETPEEPRKKKALVEGLKYTHIAFAIPGGVIAGWLLGALLDHWLGTKYLYLVGLGLGVIAGFYDLIRSVIRMNRETDGK
ncbi:MAG TPA: AtpZ/AtpI family protein [Terriglobales bacterium]|nr:AtpZ/AtpI family protein [Terriglobales bacterium]